MYFEYPTELQHTHKPNCRTVYYKQLIGFVEQHNKFGSFNRFIGQMFGAL